MRTHYVALVFVSVVAGLALAGCAVPPALDDSPGSEAPVDSSSPAGSQATGLGKVAWVPVSASMSPVRLKPRMGLELDVLPSAPEAPRPKGIAFLFSAPPDGGPWSVLAMQLLDTVPPGRAIGDRFERQSYKVLDEDGRVLYERPLPRRGNRAEWLDEGGAWHGLVVPPQDEIVNVRLPLPVGVVRLEVSQREGTNQPSRPVLSVLARTRRP